MPPAERRRAPFFVGINVAYSESSRTGIAVSTAGISAFLSSQVAGRI